ncbi:hypothetical protein [Lactiplantibacillus paraplantarum]|uniref:CobQ/CobB/MinD/ParA nucleotide binding domain-containing protein n=1 Tax=Lactiplantibacillus paraplantarum TaxID=60520 RepID=A0A2I9DSB6_9LACO|nr:hypothetical protein [Lactiplantibacillus paraplantarum]AVW10086.1 hypothetical protein DA077_05875 [Lactiplantibacillus paraplantarum]AYJ38335.1 hypothetical protein LP667_05700 [Lactiplantibacillus paraplantarum]ERL44332.1 hypothetical protein N644_1617 [Lactiplantibacillus paraplantarum]KRL49957.1 hypothetical protein FD48_GL002968 [Lactiplantibacillus paraplantarum DSM 10667]MCU4683401.1 hypothetical protein [Lactiplantibacillus paraplantarum]
MRKQPQTLVIGGTQAASGKSLLTLALANVLTNWGTSVTIVNCNYQTVTWRTIQKRRWHEWQSDIRTTNELDDFWLALQGVQTDYLLIDLESTGPKHDNYTWLLNECWLPLAHQIILTYSAETDISTLLYQDLGALQFSMEYTVTKPKIYTVLNRYPAPIAVRAAMPASELVPFHRQFQTRHAEFAAMDLQPLGMLTDARQHPEQVLTDATQILTKLVA